MKKRTLVKSTAMLIASASVGRLGAILASDEPAEVHLQDMPDRPWADPASLVSTIAAGTVAVPNAAEMVGAYQHGLGYVEHWRGLISDETARFWGAPAMAGRAAAVVGPAELKSGLVRFVELGDEFRSIPSHTTLGWAALEIRARNVDAMADQMAGSPIVHSGGPADLKFGSGPATLRAVQFKGPVGEPLFFTQDLQFDRSRLIGSNNVGGIFLQTLVAAPYVQTRDFYLKTLAMQLRAEASVPRTSVAEALGADKSRLYKMASVRAPQYCAIQIDEFPEVTPARPSTPGYLPPGVCMCTLFVRDTELVAGALRAANLPFTQIGSNPIPPGLGRRALACRGFSGEIVEFVEA
jgi:hypothetical protein